MNEIERRQMVRQKTITRMEAAGVDWLCGTCGRIMEDKESYILFHFNASGTMCRDCVEYTQDLLS